jgi:hypothetical protein
VKSQQQGISDLKNLDHSMTPDSWIEGWGRGGGGGVTTQPDNSSAKPMVGIDEYACRLFVYSMYNAHLLRLIDN